MCLYFVVVVVVFFKTCVTFLDALSNSGPHPLQVCDVSEGSSQRPSGALAEWRSRLQLLGWIPVREWTVSCENANLISNWRMGEYLSQIVIKNTQVKLITLSGEL